MLVSHFKPYLHSYISSYVRTYLYSFYEDYTVYAWEKEIHFWRNWCTCIFVYNICVSNPCCKLKRCLSILFGRNFHSSYIFFYIFTIFYGFFVFTFPNIPSIYVFWGRNIFWYRKMWDTHISIKYVRQVTNDNG